MPIPNISAETKYAEVTFKIECVVLMMLLQGLSGKQFRSKLGKQHKEKDKTGRVKKIIKKQRVGSQSRNKTGMSKGERRRLQKVWVVSQKTKRVILESFLTRIYSKKSTHKDLGLRREHFGAGTDRQTLVHYLAGFKKLSSGILFDGRVTITTVNKYLAPVVSQALCWVLGLQSIRSLPTILQSLFISEI